MPLKCREKHVIRDNDEETEDEPLVIVFFSKNEEKVLHDNNLEEDQEDIDTELEAAAIRVTQTVAEKKFTGYYC